MRWNGDPDLPISPQNTRETIRRIVIGKVEVTQSTDQISQYIARRVYGEISQHIKEIQVKRNPNPAPGLCSMCDSCNKTGTGGSICFSKKGTDEKQVSGSNKKQHPLVELSPEPKLVKTTEDTTKLVIATLNCHGFNVNEVSQILEKKILIFLLSKRPGALMFQDYQTTTWYMFRPWINLLYIGVDLLEVLPSI